MYLIIVEKGLSKYEFVTVHKDHTDNLVLIDINTKPFIYDDKDQLYLGFKGIDEVLTYIQDKFKGYSLHYKQVDHIYDLGEVKRSDMKQY